MTKLNQKTLLHTAPVAVRTVLCCAVISLMLLLLTPAWAKTSPTQPQYDALAQQERESTQLLATTQRDCAQGLAPAQCQRQAKLDFERRKHELKLKRNALQTQDKQREHAEKMAQQQRAREQVTYGLDAKGQPLQRAPMASAAPKSDTGLSNEASTNKRPLSAQVPTKQASQATTVKPPMSAKGAPQAPRTGPKQPLAAQPSTDQRRNNVAKFASKETLVAQRKTKAQQKQAKRAAKDAQRRAAGFAVDKP